MRDLVETIIGQVLKQKPAIKPAIEASQHQMNTSFQTTQVKQPLNIKDHDAWDACCQFEAIFLQQMMQAMRKTVPESDVMPRSYANNMYDSMMDQAIAESGSKQAPLGLAINIYRQLEREGYIQQGKKAQDLHQLSDKIKTNAPFTPPKSGGSNG